MIQFDTNVDCDNTVAVIGIVNSKLAEINAALASAGINATIVGAENVYLDDIETSASVDFEDHLPGND